MERVKDLSNVILRGDMILAEVVESVTNSGLILPDTAKNGFDHLKVVAVGYSITDITAGDIILDVSGQVEVYPVNGKKFATMVRHNILLAVHPDNFDSSLSKKMYLGNPNSTTSNKKLMN